MITLTAKGIHVMSRRRAPRPYPKGLTPLLQACGRSSSLHVTADTQPQHGQAGETSPHSIRTRSEAYGSGPGEGAPICSLSWACLAHSQAPHTFGWFINQPLPRAPVDPCVINAHICLQPGENPRYRWRGRKKT